MGQSNKRRRDRTILLLYDYDPLITRIVVVIARTLLIIIITELSNYRGFVIRWTGENGRGR